VLTVEKVYNEKISTTTGLHVLLAIVLLVIMVPHNERERACHAPQHKQPMAILNTKEQHALTEGLMSG